MTAATHLAEQSVLGAALNLDMGPWPPEMEGLASVDFADAAHGTVWDAVTELREAQIEPDLVAVSRRLEEFGAGDLVKMICKLAWDCPYTINAAHWARIVGEAGRARRLRGRIDDIARADNLTATDIARELAEASRIADREVTGGPRPVAALAREALLGLQAQVRDPNAGRVCWTGLTDLDKMLRLEAGDLTIIAGRPSMGKTALAANIAERCAHPDDKGGSVVFFSLEMTAQALVLRIMQRGARSTNGNLVEAIRLQRGPALVNRVDRLKLHIDDRGGLGLAQMRAALRRMGQVRLVVVDYLGLIKLESARDRRHDQLLGDTTKGLKVIAKDHGCHAISLVQLNRGAEKREDSIPHLSDLKDSGSIEEDADNVVMPYRPEYYGKGEEGVAHLYVRKQRKGATGMVKVAWIPERQSFEDLSRREP